VESPGQSQVPKRISANTANQTPIVQPDDDGDNNNNNNNNNNTAMGSVHARGDTFLTFGLKALTETNISRLATV